VCGDDPEWIRNENPDIMCSPRMWRYSWSS